MFLLLFLLVPVFCLLLSGYPHQFSSLTNTFWLSFAISTFPPLRGRTFPFYPVLNKHIHRAKYSKLRQNPFLFQSLSDYLLTLPSEYFLCKCHSSFYLSKTSVVFRNYRPTSRFLCSANGILPVSTDLLELSFPNIMTR